jgi:hypothetical protein
MDLKTLQFKKAQNVEVSDTTGDQQRTKANVKKNILRPLKLHYENFSSR